MKQLSFFSNAVNDVKITLIDESSIVSDDTLLTTTFVDFFSNAVKKSCKTLDVLINPEFVINTDDTIGPIEKAVKCT